MFYFSFILISLNVIFMPIKPIVRSVGVDLGTSSIKVSSGNRKYKIASVIGSPNPGWQGMSSDKSWLNNLIIVNPDGQETYIGELARLQSELKKPLAAEGKMKSVENSVLALKAILSLIMETSYEHFVVATGVPALYSACVSETIFTTLSDPVGSPEVVLLGYLASL